MHRLLFPIIFAFVIFVSSCGKEYTKYAYLSYDQTVCADAWVTGSTDSVTIQNARHYLDSLRLYFLDISIRLERVADSCLACTCKTGRVIRVFTFEDQQERFAAHGFY